MLPGREPHDDVDVLPHRQCRVVVLRVLRDEARQDPLAEGGLDHLEVGLGGTDHRRERCVAFRCANRGTPRRVDLEGRADLGGPQEQDVVDIHHRRVRRDTVGAPDGARVERLQRRRAACEVGEPAQPDELIRIVEVAKRPQNSHPERLLRLDELTVEQLDQPLARARLQRVPP